MIFFVTQNDSDIFEEEEEEEAGIDDALLGELADELDDELDEEFDPLLKETAFDVLTEETDEPGLADDGSKLFDDEEEDDEEDMDYDSFDDKDEM